MNLLPPQVIRTFGTDGPQVGEAIAAWTAGGHGLPSVPDFTVNAGWQCRFAQAGLFSLNRGAEVLGPFSRFFYSENFRSFKTPEDFESICH